ncbi:MAG: DUF4198 domain-containing protein [Gammaproteobacteria bacterium]|nr:MAG: DUF4198 domain-containing protein [Gammaproteobacteria bacterium]
MMRLLSVVAGLLLAPGAVAHDFWIEPGSFRPAVGAKVPLRLFVGMDFAGEPTVYLPDTFERYAVIGPDGERNISGTLGDDPAGQFTVSRPGPYIVAYRSTRFTVTFDTLAEFEQYLEKEGLERVKTLRAYGTPKGKIIRENYSRSAKALVITRKARTSSPDRALGLRLELVAEANPLLTDRLPVRLLYEGRPLEGALVVAFSKTEPYNKLKMRTDKDGRVIFNLLKGRDGPWIITTVHMFPAPPKTNADWESVWASLTFERP